MEDKSTFIESYELFGADDLHKERWKQDSDNENILKNKLRLLLVLFSFLVLLSLVAVVTILAWAYIEQKQFAGDGAQLHEPTRLYSSTAAATPPGVNATKSQQSYESEEQRSAIPGNTNGQMHLIRVYEGLNTGAVCLDGTPPAYYLRPGRDLGTNRWIIHFNGGAWCFDEAACLERSRGSLGSTKHLPPSPPVIQGINSANEQINPDFFDWNLVWVVYCDGASFTGDRQDPVVVHGESIFFRGKRVLDAVIEDLMKRGFQNAEGVILTGSSAGSMTAMFAVDRLAERLPNVPMHVLSDAGYFIETQQMGGKSVGGLFKQIYDMQNSSAGLDQDCMRAFGMKNGWRCFLPQHTFKFIKHPVFVLNAAYDVWAMLYFVGIDCKFPAVQVQNQVKKSDVGEENSAALPVTNHREVRGISEGVKRRADQYIGAMHNHENPDNTTVTNDRAAREILGANNNAVSGGRVKNADAVDDITIKHQRAVRDISGFEILPYFRSRNSDIAKEAADMPTKNDEFAENINMRKDGIPKEAANPEKRNFEPPVGESDLVDSLNTFTLNDYADNYYNERIVNPRVGNEAGESPKLHLNINQENQAEESRTNGFTTNENEAEVPSIQNIKDMSNVLANDKQEAMTLNPLASSVNALNNVAENVQKDSMDTETIGLLNEVFKKLKKLVPKHKGNGTNDKKMNATNGLIKAAKPGQLPADQNEVKNAQNEVEAEKTKGDNDKEEQLKIEKLKSKEITKKINDMLKVKQAELIKTKQQKSGPMTNVQNKQGHVSSSAIIANMFKKAGKLPNPTNVKIDSKEPVQREQPKVSSGLNRNSIVQNKNKRSANIIKEYINILRSDPPECTETQMINVMKYRNAMLRATAIVKATKDSGIFLVSCIEHSMSLFDETWTGVIVQTKSIQQAFGDWYYGRETNHYMIDGVYPSNPSCP